jgi:hypothetical protein
MTRRTFLALPILALLCTSAIAFRSSAATQARQDWREYGGHQGTR